LRGARARALANSGAERRQRATRIEQCHTLDLAAAPSPPISDLTSRHVLQHQKRFLIVFVADNVVELHNVWMVEQLHDFDFSLDTLCLIVDVVHQTPIDDFNGILQEHAMRDSADGEL
jgi:hypothetical protein